MTFATTFRRVWRATVVAVLCLAALLVIPNVARAAPASFVFKGSGWGHRVGMAQFGALEQAADGRSWQTILAHYYTGTSIGTNEVPARIRVFLAGAAPQVTVEGGSRFSFTSGGDEKAASPGGDGRWTVRVQPAGHFTVYRPNGTPAAAAINASQPLKLNYEPWSSVVAVHETGLRYRWGKIELQANGDKIRMVLDIPLERYLRGLAEVPSSWPTEALRAQAVAARTYAADKARRSGHHRAGCDCTLFSDTRDQVYRAYEREDPAISVTARWVAAVDATAGKVVTHSGHPIQAYYHSSSGGRTESSADVWSTGLPYLQPVNDPWSMRPSNPYAHWEVRLAQEVVATKLDFKRVDAIEVKSKTAGGGVKEVTIRGDRSTTMRGTDFRSKLGLRSTMMTIAGSAEAIWETWRRVRSNDRASGSPAMASAPNGALHAIVVSPTNVPYASRRDPSSGLWSSWSRIGPASSAGTEPAIAIEPSGAVHALLRGRSGAMYTARRDPGSGSWSGWSRIGPSGSRGREPEIAAGPDGVVWAVIRGYSSADVYAARRGTNGVWSGWTKVGRDANEPAVAALNGGAVLAVRGGNNAIKAAVYQGGWSGLTQVGGGFGKTPALAAGAGKVVIAVRGRSSEHLHSSTFSGGTWSRWSQVSPDLVATGAEPSVAIDPNGVSHLFVRGPGDLIFTASRGSGGWAGFFQVGDGNDRAASGTAIAPAAAKGRVYVLIRGPGAGLYWSSRTAA